MILNRRILTRHRLSAITRKLLLPLLICYVMGSLANIALYMPVVGWAIYSSLLIYGLLPMLCEIFIVTSKEQTQEHTYALFQAVESEREAISLYIHDTVIQEVIFAKKEVDGLEGVQAKTAAVTALDEIVYELRELCSDIYPLMIQEIGFKKTLLSLVQRFEQDYPVSVQTLISDEAIRLPNQTSNFLLRSVRELITNSIKHGGADRIRLSFYQNAQMSVIQVSDNGQFKVGTDVGNHFGLNVIREKVALLGGNMTVEIKDGTVVSIEIPQEEK